MSATLGTLLRQLDPTLSIEIFERLDVTAAESSDAWNNAGTGHAAFCELNYTPADQMEAWMSPRLSPFVNSSNRASSFGLIWWRRRITRPQSYIRQITPQFCLGGG